MQEKLKTLYEQMENELRFLKPVEKQRIKVYMMWAFERGENDMIRRLKK